MGTIAILRQPGPAKSQFGVMKVYARQWRLGSSTSLRIETPLVEPGLLQGARRGAGALARPLDTADGVADRVGVEWVKQRFALSGVTIETSADPKAIIYGNFLPMLNSGRVSLLDNKRLISQLVGLERFSGSGGRDQRDAAPGGHSPSSPGDQM